MLIPKEEMFQRYKAAQKIMFEKQLEAILLLGDRMPGDEAQGDFHYFANNYVLSDRHCILMFPDSDPILYPGGWIQAGAAKERSWFQDIRIAKGTAELKKAVLEGLKEKNYQGGRIGTVFQNLTWEMANALREAFPKVEFVNVHEDIFKLRQVHSKTENQLIRKSAELCDKAFEQVCRILRPGITENEILAEIEKTVIAGGAERSFNILSSGRYSTDPAKNQLPLPFVPKPSGRVIEKGDTVYLEITPCFDGYWSQLVRYVSVGEPDPGLQKAHELSFEIIQACREVIRPGNRVSDICKTARAVMKGLTADYCIGANVGHICSLDLDEIALTDDNETALVPGMAVILHPSIMTADQKCEIFCGETYMVTEGGNECLMKASKDLVVL